MLSIIKLRSKSRILLPFALILFSLHWTIFNEESVISNIWMSSRILDVCIHSFIWQHKFHLPIDAKQNYKIHLKLSLKKLYGKILLGVPLQNQDRLDVLLGPGVTVLENHTASFGYTLIYDYCYIWTHPAYIYICARTKSRNFIFLILSVLYQRQNIFEFKFNVQNASSSWCYVIFVFILCNCIMLKYFVEGEGLGGLKEKETVFMIQRK